MIFIYENLLEYKSVLIIIEILIVAAVYISNKKKRVREKISLIMQNIWRYVEETEILINSLIS